MELPLNYAIGDRRVGLSAGYAGPEACFNVDLVYIYNQAADLTPLLNLLPPHLRTHTTINEYNDNITFAAAGVSKDLCSQSPRLRGVATRLHMYLEADILIHRYMLSWHKHERRLRPILGSRTFEAGAGRRSFVVRDEFGD